MKDRARVPRRPETVGPLPGATGWLALDDDALVFRIQSLPADHRNDLDLMDVVGSSRHFFVRQEAAKRIHDLERLKAFAGDRHIGQVLARQMTRASDAGYLELLLRESRHLEVRNAATAQLRLLRQQRAAEGLPPGLTAERRSR